MQAGQLNRRIDIQSQTTTQDVYGQESLVWASVYQCWASIEAQNSQLPFSTAEFIERSVWRITFRWTSSAVIQPNMRIIYTEPTTAVVHTYEIESLVNDKQRNRQLIALCYELEASE